jgi:hypothetical protein
MRIPRRSFVLLVLSIKLITPPFSLHLTLFTSFFAFFSYEDVWAPTELHRADRRSVQREIQAYAAYALALYI